MTYREDKKRNLTSPLTYVASIASATLIAISLCSCAGNSSNTTNNNSENAANTSSNTQKNTNSQLPPTEVPTAQPGPETDTSIEFDKTQKAFSKMSRSSTIESVYDQIMDGGLAAGEEDTPDGGHAYFFADTVGESASMDSVVTAVFDKNGKLEYAYFEQPSKTASRRAIIYNSGTLLPFSGTPLDPQGVFAYDENENKLYQYDDPADAIRYVIENNR